MNNILQERDELIYHLRAKIKELEGELQRTRSSEILSLPSGYTTGDHKITIAEALDLFGKIVTDYPSYPHIGYYKGRRISHE